MTSFDIKHNNDNDGIAKIYMHLAYSCSGSIQPEDLLVGKILLDTSLQHNKIRATMGIQYFLHLTTTTTTTTTTTMVLAMEVIKKKKSRKERQ
jgi:hypothetical protein